MKRLEVEEMLIGHSEKQALAFSRIWGRCFAGVIVITSKPSDAGGGPAATYFSCAAKKIEDFSEG